MSSSSTSSSSSSSSSQNRQLMHSCFSSHLRQTFAIIDRDGDGKIAPSDLHHFFNMLPINRVSEEDIESMMRVADVDHKGYVQFEEFERIITSFTETSRKSVYKFQEKSAMEEMFEIIDRDGDGVISLADLREFMAVVMQESHLNQRQLTEMIKEAGGSVHSGITKQDFLAMMTSKILKM